MALTKPVDYAAARQAEFDKVVAGVQTVYQNSYQGFSNAGMPHEMAKGYALARSKHRKTTQAPNYGDFVPQWRERDR